MAPKKSKRDLEVSTPNENKSKIAHTNEEIVHKQRPFLQVHRQQETRALLILLFFSVLMFSLPFGAYYGTRSLLDEYFHLDYFATTCWSVIASVVTVGIIVAVYALIGYYETEYDDEGNVIDQKAVPEDDHKKED